MAALSFESAYRDVKRGDIAPVYYLTGDADLLKDDLVALVIDAALDPVTRDFNLDVRFAGDLDAPTLGSLVDTLPVLSQRRVVVIKSLEQWRKNSKPWEALRRYVERPSPSTVLVLVHGAGETPEPALTDRATQVDVQTPGREALLRWVEQRARGMGMALEPDAVEHLVRSVGPDLGRLATELEKLAAAIGADRVVGVADVVELVGVNRGETVDDWVEAVLARDPGRALHLTDVVMPQAGVTAVRMVMALGTELVGVRLARALADQGLAGPRLERAVFDQLRQARPVGVGSSWESKARDWAAAAQRWAAGDLDRALRAAYDADRALKATTVSDDRAALRTLLLALEVREAAA
jgi:DNA polymerase-3 subunit delta